MVTGLLAAAAVLLTGYDAWWTQVQMKDYGVSIELTDSVRAVVERTSIEAGVALSILLPGLCMIALLSVAHLQWVLAILVGYRAHMTANQYRSRQALKSGTRLVKLG